MANRLGRPRRARETRKAAIQVLDLVNQVTDEIQTDARPHPAVRDKLIEEPGEAGLLMVQIVEELTELRVKVRIRIGRRLEVLNKRLHVKGHLEAVMPLLKDLLPLKDAGVRVR